MGDIDRVLNCLVYDGKLEKMDGPNDGIVYRVVHQYLEPAFIEIPCATCPVQIIQFSHSLNSKGWCVTFLFLDIP